jgi:MFS family permease
MGIGFMFVFTAYNTSQNYAVTLLGGNAYYVLSILYCFAAFSNFASSSVLSIFGKNTKVALTSASFCYVQYLAVISAYLYFKDMQDILRWVLYGSAALIGFGAAILWTAQGTLLALNSDESTRGVHMGLFWAFFQVSLVAGNIIAYFVFAKEIEPFILFAVFIVVASFGGFLFLTLRRVEGPAANPVDVEALKQDVNEPINSTRYEVKKDNEFVATLKMLKSRELLPQLPIFGMISMMTSYQSGTFPLLFNEDKSRVGAIFTGFGISVIVSALIGGKIKDRLSSKKFLIITLIIDFLAIACGFLGEFIDRNTEKPHSMLYYSMYFGFMIVFGAADSFTSVYVYTLLGGLFPNKPESSRSIAMFKFVQSLGSATAFFYGKFTDGKKYFLFILQTN